MNRERIVELARTAECSETFGMDYFKFTIEELERFVALIEAEVRGDGQPVAWHYKKVGGGWFVSDNEPQYVEQWNDIEEIKPLYTHLAPDVVTQLAEALERCEELGYDKATYFRLYEAACIELQNIKKQTPSAEIKVSHSELEGERIEVVSCELGVGIHDLYALPVADVVAQLVEALEIAREIINGIEHDSFNSWNVYEAAGYFDDSEKKIEAALAAARGEK